MSRYRNWRRHRERSGDGDVGVMVDQPCTPFCARKSSRVQYNIWPIHESWSAELYRNVKPLTGYFSHGLKHVRLHYDVDNRAWLWSLMLTPSRSIRGKVDNWARGRHRKAKQLLRHLRHVESESRGGAALASHLFQIHGPWWPCAKGVFIPPIPRRTFPRFLDFQVLAIKSSPYIFICCGGIDHWTCHVSISFGQSSHFANRGWAVILT